MQQLLCENNSVVAASFSDESLRCIVACTYIENKSIRVDRLSKRDPERANVQKTSIVRFSQRFQRRL